MEGETRNWPLDLVRVGLLLVAVSTHALVGVSIAQSYGTDEFSRRDWSAFRDAGRRVLDSQLDGLYDARPGGFPFLHPPHVAAVLAPTGRLGDGAYYLMMLGIQLLGLGASWLALCRLSQRREGRDIVLLGMIASAPWAIAVVLGQPSALLLSAWLVAFWAMGRGRPLSAGLLLGLCALKPIYLIAPIAYALLGRRHRVLGGIVVSVAMLLGLSLFVGQWTAWLAAVSRTLGDVSAAEVALWKQHTLLAFLRSLMPRTPALAAWGLVTATFALRLYQLRPHFGGPAVEGTAVLPKLRALGWLALGTVALSPFAYFYDALLLSLPAAALWLHHDSYLPRQRVVLMALAGLTFVAQHVEFFLVQSGTPWVGGLAVIWFGFELYGLDALAARGSDSRPLS